MAAKQTSTLLGRLVEHQDYFNSIPTADAQWAIQNPKDAAALCVAAIQNRAGTLKIKRTYGILRPVGQKQVEIRPFKADETFFNQKSGVRMTYHGVNFCSWFAGKVEEDAPTGDLQPLVLIQTASDSQIIADLGGEEKAEVILTEIWRLMERQRNGEEGMLLTNGWASIFYVCDTYGVLRAVVVRWSDDGWFAGASALGGGRWDGGNQVFSRNS